MTKTTFIGAALAIGGLVLGGPAFADGKYDPGASDTEIKIGNTNPYSGPASSYSMLGKGLTAYFDMINDKGGINGRKINFISLDDGYSPPKTVEQTRKLVEQEEVLFLFQTLGTPTNSAIHKYVNKKEIPHLFIATGASKWGQPEKYPWTMGWQPAYTTEGKAFAQYVLENVDDPKIGILYQNDDYGKDFLNGMKEGLGDLADKLIVAEEPYEVTDPTVDSQIVALKNSGANVFYNISIPKFAAQAIRKSYDIGWKPLHLLNYVAASIRAVLEPAGLDKSEGIISALFMKDPNNALWADDADVKEWLNWMQTYYPDGDVGESFNVYSYAVAYSLVQVLEACGDDLTRENIMRQAANLKNVEVPLLLDGIKMNTSATDFYPLEELRLARFDGAQWVPFGEIIVTH